MSVRILGDSTSDITPEMKEKYGVVTIPMYVNFEDRTYRDGEDLMCADMFAESKRTGIHPKSACPTPADVADFLRREHPNADELLYIAMSGNISPIVNFSMLASQETGIPLHIVDSTVLSSGVTYLMIRASEMIADGKSAEEIVPVLDDIKQRLNVSFVIDTMTYLHRGGRCSSVTALMASTLKIKPQIILQDGKMVPAAKFRGSMLRAVDQYIDLLTPNLKNAVPDRIFITHTISDEEMLGILREKLEAFHRFEEIHVVHAGCVVGTHCGPGTMGFIFEEGK